MQYEVVHSIPVALSHHQLALSEANAWGLKVIVGAIAVGWICGILAVA